VAGGSCHEMGPAVDFAVHAHITAPPPPRTPQSSPARNALSCHPPECRLRHSPLAAPTPRRDRRQMPPTGSPRRSLTAETGVRSPVAVHTEPSCLRGLVVDVGAVGTELEHEQPQRPLLERVRAAMWFALVAGLAQGRLRFLRCLARWPQRVLRSTWRRTSRPMTPPCRGYATHGSASRRSHRPRSGLCSLRL
jgi:hypothetical protein